ncbi:MAG: WecB/TagA/CpsF family glycosyltransferase [Cyanobacteria bacterium P01_D01_bin.71]
MTSKARQLLVYEKDSLSKRIAKRIQILDVGIDNFAVDELLHNLNKGVVFTPNVDHLMRLREDREFVEAYDVADFRVCDSQILMYASKFLGTPIRAKISGSDLFPMFCEHHRDNPDIKIFLLGGAEGVPQMAQMHINQRIGRDIIVAAHSPSYGFEKNEAECERILEMIRQSPANVLIVGVGAPKQEKWIAKYHKQLPDIDIFMGVGAAIDFEAGNKSRSPKWMSELGLEWLYRLVSEPRRLWKRYLLQDLPFFWLLFKQKFASIPRQLLSSVRSQSISNDLESR